jgi:type IV pilus assembly protein PilA
MKTLKREQKGFTLIELLIVVAMLGILAAVILPNLGRFVGKGEDEAKEAEFSTIHAALHAMMIDNDLETLPSGFIDNADDATNDMGSFPGGGYVLHGHAHPTDNVTINYLATNTSSYWYYTDTLGTLYQLVAAP